jgi:hypothetical protein
MSTTHATFSPQNHNTLNINIYRNKNKQKFKVLKRNKDSTVSIMTGYGLDGRGVGVQVPVGARFFSSHVVQTGS